MLCNDYICSYVCSGGVGRTGVFCGISMMIERVKSEGVIDVFQTVQAMRLQRPAMVQTAVRPTDVTMRVVTPPPPLHPSPEL